MEHHYQHQQHSPVPAMAVAVGATSAVATEIPFLQSEHASVLARVLTGEMDAGSGIGGVGHFSLLDEANITNFSLPCESSSSDEDAGSSSDGGGGGGGGGGRASPTKRGAPKEAALKGSYGTFAI